MSKNVTRRESGTEYIYGHLCEHYRDPWHDHEVFWFGGALVVVRMPNGGIIVDVVNVTLDGYDRRVKYARAKAAGRGRRPRKHRLR